MNLLLLALSAALVNNVVLSQFLGLCPFLGVSKKVGTAAGMGAAVTFVLTLASMITYGIQVGILNEGAPLCRADLTFLQTIVFILVIAALVQFVEMVLKKLMPALYQALGVYLPLITTNCAVLGVAILNIQKSYSFLESIINSVGTALGFTIAIVVLAGLREKMEHNDIPEAFKGMPIVLITSGLMAIAFFGFSGLI
ncbi:MAG: RnfABCDGE type electron transport complex subunit A [Lachnospiraceae bacterium]|nr:RnfABCDGE type electron transport complex subunit A [Lachnospiraceae bacterium]